MSIIVKYIKEKLFSDQHSGKKKLKDIPNIEQFFSSERYDLTTDINEKMIYKNRLVFFLPLGDTVLELPLIEAIKNSALKISDPTNILAKLDWHRCIKQLIEHGAVLNEKFLPNHSLLMSTVLQFLELGDSNTTELLLTLGLNCFLRDINNYTVMDWIITANSGDYRALTYIEQENYNTTDRIIGLSVVKRNRHEKIKDYIEFFSFNPKISDLQITWFQKDLLLRKFEISMPILRHWSKTLYKHFLDLRFVLKNEFSKFMIMPPSMINIIALYETSSLIMDISFVLEKNPKLFNEIKQSLCKMLEFSMSNKTGSEDSEVVNFISLIFSDHTSAIGNKEKKEIIEQYQAKLAIQG